MKAFRFSLQTVLALRERAEQEAQQRFATATTAHNNALQQVRNAEQDLRTAWQSIKTTCTRGAPAAEIYRLNTWSAAAQDEVRKRQIHADGTKATLEKFRRELQRATQKRQALENLRQRRRLAYQQNVLREEQKQIDEVAGRRRPSPAMAEVSTTFAQTS